MAIEDVNRDPHLLPGRRLQYEVADVGHSGSDALAALSIRRMTMMRDAGLLAFIGPDDNCANEALVAAAWNLPMITYVSVVLIRYYCLRRESIRYGRRSVGKL